MPVRFRSTRLSDQQAPFIIEDAFRALGSFGNILNFNFDSLYRSVTGWDDGASGVSVSPSADSLTLTAPASPGSTWFPVIASPVELPRGYLLRFDVTSARWAAAMAWLDDGEHYLVGVDSGSPFIAIWNGLTQTYDTLISQSDLVAPQTASVEIAFREIRFGDASQEVYHTLALWMNRQLILSAAYAPPNPIVGAIRTGFAVYSGDSVTYSNINLPELTIFADWVSLDPGEKPMSALARAIEGYYLKMFVRFDGSLRAWRSKPSPSVYTYTDSVVDNREVAHDIRSLKTRIRQVGAYTEAEYKRDDLIRKYGDRFTILYNPYLMTEAECYEQAQASIRRLEETTLTERFETPYQPLLEIEDHITTPAGERILTSRNVQFTMTGAIEQINARNYAYEE